MSATAMHVTPLPEPLRLQLRPAITLELFMQADGRVFAALCERVAAPSIVFASGAPSECVAERHVRGDNFLWIRQMAVKVSAEQLDRAAAFIGIEVEVEQRDDAEARHVSP